MVKTRQLSCGIVCLVLLLPIFSEAQDSDNDGLDDQMEIKIYKTDPQKADTDNDGFFDGQEIKNNYSPVRANYKLDQLDWDKDGLNDKLELAFGTDLKIADIDGDGISDGVEVANGFSPTSTSKIKLSKQIKINIKDQQLQYSLGGIVLNSFRVSTGKNNSTPRGTFSIRNKTPKAWSRVAKLWMPYWMAYSVDGRLGLHELPYWPGGKREGEASLGKPVSGGCVRLGVGVAKKLYDWAEIGTTVIIN